MESLHLALTLESDVVLSSSAATIGGHETLRFVPGAALLGAIACLPRGGTNLYESVGERAFRLFHSGAVRFGNGWPDDGAGGGALPIPLSFHCEKRADSEEAADRSVTRPTEVLNLAVAARPAGRQFVQERQGFLDADGRWVRVHTRYTMRTAVGSHGQARDGLLFGYECVAAGQRFLARIDADDGEDLRLLEDALFGSHAEVILHLGRSKSAEFGRVKVRVTEGRSWPLDQDGASQVAVLFASDTALRDDETGLPRWEPAGRDFGLEDWEVDWERSFLRFRSWSPFHGARRRPDTERQAIAAGSVLVLRPPPGDAGAVDGAALAREATRAGIGDWREEGLGQVIVQPALLAGRTATLRTGLGPPTPPREPPADLLGGWVRQRAEEGQKRDDAEEVAQDLQRDLGWLARGRLRIPPSQWGELRRLGFRWSRDGERLLKEVRAKVGLDAKAKPAAVVPPRTSVGYGKDAANPDVGRGAAARRWSELKRRGRTAAEALVEALEGPAVRVDLRGAVLERIATRLAAEAQKTQEDER